jgi:hypothetical protein
MGLALHLVRNWEKRRWAHWGQGHPQPADAPPPLTARLNLKKRRTPAMPKPHPQSEAYRHMKPVTDADTLAALARLTRRNDHRPVEVRDPVAVIGSDGEPVEFQHENTLGQTVCLAAPRVVAMVKTIRAERTAAATLEPEPTASPSTGPASSPI